MTFYERCEELANQKSISMNELGRRIGISGPAITGWKNGSYPKIDIAQRVAEEFDVSLDYLITGKTTGLSQEDTDLLNKYHSLPEPFKVSVDTMIDQVIGYIKKE